MLRAFQLFTDTIQDYVIAWHTRSRMKMLNKEQSVIPNIGNASCLPLLLCPFAQHEQLVNLPGQSKLAMR